MLGILKQSRLALLVLALALASCAEGVSVEPPTFNNTAANDTNSGGGGGGGGGGGY